MRKTNALLKVCFYNFFCVFTRLHMTILYKLSIISPKESCLVLHSLQFHVADESATLWCYTCISGL